MYEFFLFEGGLVLIVTSALLLLLWLVLHHLVGLLARVREPLSAVHASGEDFDPFLQLLVWVLLLLVIRLVCSDS